MLHGIRLVQDRAVSPVHAYVFALVVGRPRVGTYTSRRTGQTVFLRPREDIHVTRELLMNDVYTPPQDVGALLEREQALSVLDLGANIGLFALNVLRRYGGRTTVTAVEPDPENVRLLRRNVATNGYSHNVEILEAAVGRAEGRADFSSGLAELSQLSHLAAERRRRRAPDRLTVRVVDFFSLAQRHAFIKMDIEGAEWAILRDRRLRGLEPLALVLEWHREGAGTSHPAAEADRLLRTAGFDEIRHVAPAAGELADVPPASEPAGALWAWRRARLSE